MKRFYIPILIITIITGLFSCDNVEEGYTINYDESQANFSVELLTQDRGAIDDTIKFEITAQSDYDIQSLVVTTSESGAEGTGFIIKDDAVDPLVDHVYGIIQPDTKELDLYYYYIIKQDSIDPTITFKLVNEEGLSCDTFDLYAIPDIVSYTDISLYAQDNQYADGFSTSDGTIYQDLTNYEDVSTVNDAIQETLDIIFIMYNKEAMIVAPYNSYFSNDMSTKNKTLFKLIDDMSGYDFDELTAADVSIITENYSVKKGSTYIDNLQVGDVIGFRTDYASSNPYHYGLLRINAMHPANCDYYDETCYIIEFDITTQQ